MDTENPASFNEYREAYARMKAERDQLARDRKELAEAVLIFSKTTEYPDVDASYAAMIELAQEMIK